MLFERTQRRRRYHRSAFTLMELLLVLAILVILGGLAINLYSGVNQQAQVKAAKGDIGLIKSAIRLFQSSNGTLPDTLNDLLTPPGDLQDTSKWGGPYLEKKPMDPWSHDYIYEVQDPSSGSFTLFSAGPDGSPNTQDDVRD